MSVIPLSPAQALQQKGEYIPDGVVQAVNDLLVKKMSKTTRSIVLRQCDIIDASCAHMGIHREKFELSWLDFEALFEGFGWKVSYDKPGYNESYEPTFEFTVA